MVFPRDAVPVSAHCCVTERTYRPEGNGNEHSRDGRGHHQHHPGNRQAPPRHAAARANPARIAATAAVAAFGLTALTAGAASAGTVANGPTIQLSQYPVPASAPQPQHVPGGGMLPQDNGVLGNAASIAVTGVRSPDAPEVVTIPGGSSAWGTQLETDEPSTAPTLGPAQVWYFQRVGYAGVNTPATTAAGGTDMLAVPVYRIINYNPDGLYTCLEALGSQPSAGSIVDSNGCDVNGGCLHPVLCDANHHPPPAKNHKTKHHGRVLEMLAAQYH